MNKLLTMSALVIATSYAMNSQAGNFNYDYFDLDLVEQEANLAGEKWDGYNVDVGFSLGSKFYLKLGFDNVESDKAVGNRYFVIDRIKTRRFGFGYRNSLNDDLDFVAEYTQDDYHFQTEQNPDSPISFTNFNDHGDTTKVGLRGALFERLEWDAFVKRKTFSDMNMDDIGYELALRYRVVKDFDLSVGVEDIGDEEKVSFGFRYQY